MLVARRSLGTLLLPEFHLTIFYRRVMFIRLPNLLTPIFLPFSRPILALDLLLSEPESASTEPVSVER